MAVTLEAVDTVIERTGCTYKEAKEALEQTDGDVVEAIVLLQKDDTNEVIEKVKAAVKQGNVDKIVVTRKGETVLSIPVNVGILGGVIGLAAAPAALIIGAIAAYGMDCRIEVVKNDGSSEEL